jgi:hypothetical protein
MTREEHIAKAEELLVGEFNPSLYPNGRGWFSKPTEAEIARAQVHATLALACPPAEPVAETAARRFAKWLVA